MPGIIAVVGTQNAEYRTHHPRILAHVEGRLDEFLDRYRCMGNHRPKEGVLAHLAILNDLIEFSCHSGCSDDCPQNEERSCGTGLFKPLLYARRLLPNSAVNDKHTEQPA
jgi:hypothetical protein